MHYRAVGSLVGDSSSRCPFIIDGHLFYLARSLSEEQDIADVLMRDSCMHVHVLLGGPGTGKTTKIAHDLVERFSALPAESPWPRLGLAAPTGKAASRMTDVLRQRCVEVGASPNRDCSRDGRTGSYSTQVTGIIIHQDQNLFDTIRVIDYHTTL